MSTAAAWPTAPSPAILDPDRLAAVRATGLLGALPDAALDRLTRLAARVLRAPVAVVSLVDSDRQFLAGCTGLGEPRATVRETPLSHSFCQHVVAERAPLVVADARTHPLVADNPSTVELGVAAYAGVPLVTRDGQVIGSFCVVDRVPRGWSDDDLATLDDLARTAMAEIELRRASDALASHGAALAARETELTDLLDHTGDLVCATDAEGRITYVNAAWREAFGYTVQEAAQLRPLDMVAPQHQAKYLEAAHRVVRGEAVRDFEAVLIAKTSRRVVCRGWATPRMEPGPAGPRYLGTRAVYRDVTKERRAEAVRARLVATLEATPDLVGVATTDGWLVYLNRAGRRLAGLADDADLSVISLDDLWPDAEQARMAAEALPSAVRDGVWEGEAVLHGAGGELIPVSQVLVAHPSTRPGEPPYFVSVMMRDLRERVRGEARLRASEARFRAAIDAGLDAFYVLEAVRAGADDAPGGRGAIVDFTIVDANAQAAALVGMPREDLIGHSLCELFPLARAAGYFDRYVEVVRSGEAWDGEFEPTDPRVAAEWVWMQAVPFGDGVALTTRDVTERRRAEQFRDQLIATASHELRSPLTAIKGALDLLARGSAGRSEREARLVEMAHRNAERLVRMVNDLLDVERIESGAAPLDVQAVAAGPLLTSACEFTHLAADAAGVTVSAAADAAGALRVWADPGRVLQVLANLIGNAVKFSPAGTHVMLGAEAVGDEVRFAVRDAGRGIPAEKLEAIFERFGQVSPKDAKEKGGAGLGLAISRALVEQHGGRIWAESAPGAGSVFYFTLPSAERRSVHAPGATARSASA